MSSTTHDDRRYPARPVLGIGALIFRGEQILLAERGKEPLKGWWSLPGGALESGERLRDGIRREVREETGLEVEPSETFTIFERIMPDSEGRAEYHYVLVDYICEITGGEERAGDDVSRLAWAAEQDLGNYQLTEGTLGVILDAFRKRK